MRSAVTNEVVAKGETKARSAAWLTIMIVVLIAGLVSPARAQMQILKTDFTNPAPPADRQANDKDWSSNVCGGSTFMNNASPIFEWGPVFGSEFDTQLVGLSGTIPFDPTISGGDLPFTHPFGTDWEFFIIPDDDYAPLLAPSNGCTSFTDSGECVNSIDFHSPENKPKNSECTDAGMPDKCCTAPGAGSCNINVEFREAVEKIHSDKNLHLPKKTELGVQGILGFETDQGLVPSHFRNNVHAGDRVVMFGRWITDCGHPDFHTEMHPPLLTAFGHVDTGSAGQPKTTTEVISRPYLTSQTFEDGKGVRHHMYNELLKGLAVPACEPFEFAVNKLTGEDVGCRATVCIPNPFGDDICTDLFCTQPELWFTTPCTTRFEAHQHFEPKTFNFDSKNNGPKTMSYIVSPPIPRQCEKRKLLVSAHFTVRHGVTATVEPIPTDAARVTITMDDREYTQPPLPPKADLSFSLDDLGFLNQGSADTIFDIRAVANAISPIDSGPLFTALVARGLLTDCYDPSYGILGPADHPFDTFPDCAALKPLTASSPADSQNEVVAKPIDELSGPVSAEDNSKSQVFPIYGHLDLEWSQEKFPPNITITQPTATTYVHSDKITLDYSATDTGCGVASVTATMDGAPTLRDGQTLDNGQTIHLTELTLGDHTFTVSAGDNVGGTNSVSVTFSIIVTADSIKEDVNEFLADGLIKNAGEASSLLAKLDAAAAARSRGQCNVAANQYGSFINELQAQSGNGVDANAAAIMIGDAQYLITHCP